MGSGEILPGDWHCGSCDVNNFARRTHCIDCQKPKEDLIDSKENGVEGEEKSDNDLKIESTEETVDKTGDVDHDNRVGSREVREGDWTCSSCKANNFARRQACFKCKANKDGSAGDSDKFQFRNGDWSCSTCGTHNFARRSACFQCRKQRPEGCDWICMGCNMNNFARRAYCFGCQAPKYQSDRDSNHYHNNNPYYNGPPNDGYYGRGPPPPRNGGMGRNPIRNGDWMCTGCNFHNFARRDTCKGCGEHKGETEVVQDRKQGVQPGDWGCDSCGENNWARRTKCYKCEEPKPLLED